MNRVIIFGEQLMSNQSIKLFLESKGVFEVLLITDSYQTFFDFLNIRTNRPELIIIDFSNFIMDSFSVLDELKRRRFHIYILSIFSFLDYDCLYRLSSYNIQGFLFKSSSLDELLFSINYIFNGKCYFHPMLIPVFNTFMISHGFDDALIKLLTNREKEILHFISMGYSNKELAIDLNISERTVKNHIFNLFRKINCSDRSQAILFALRNNV